MYSARTFGETLREHLSSHGISQKWVAEKMNTTYATVSRYVSGERVPSVESLVELAQTLNVSVDFLLGVEPPEKSRTPADVSVLTDCYARAPIAIRKILWTAMDPYMSPEQRIVIDASMSIEEKSNVG